MEGATTNIVQYAATLSMYETIMMQWSVASSSRQRTEEENGVEE